MRLLMRSGHPARPARYFSARPSRGRSRSKKVPSRRSSLAASGALAYECSTIGGSALPIPAISHLMGFASARTRHVGCQHSQSATRIWRLRLRRSTMQISTSINLESWIGRSVSARRSRARSGRPLATHKVPVVLDPWMAMDLLRAIGPLFSADSVLKGRSLFANKIGQRVANEKVTIVDDARRPRGLRSAPFDGEGVATATRTLIESGVLRGYLTSLKTARKLGTESTGNARRGGYGSPARIGPSNLFVAAGSDDATAIVGDFDRALAVTSLLNLHTIDPVSGEFSLGATGNYLEHGNRIHPAQGITIAGNLTHLLNSVVAVGNDLVFGPSGLGSPTLVISELSIGGA